MENQIDRKEIERFAELIKQFDERQQTGILLMIHAVRLLTKQDNKDRK
mgnify:FL=1